MIVIGERLNSSRPAVREALAGRDESYLVEQARLQASAGAHYLDINAAALLENETETLRWAVPVLQEAAGLPLSIDSPNPMAMEAALAVHRGRALLNSVPGTMMGRGRWLPLINRYHPRVVVLCLDGRGGAPTPVRSLAIARSATRLLLRQGLMRGDIFIDPLVYSAAAGENAAARFLASLRLVKAKLPGVKTLAGLSNISFGLPHRRLLNRAFLAMALEAGLDAAICDPLDKELREALLAGEVLLGRNPERRTASPRLL